ncbi:MAG: DUF411 domain-containing protein [Gemmatimonadaceae bacterium]
MGVPSALGACHTSVGEGYIFSGHVSVSLIERVVAERPAIAGLAVPGMPAGSPGMQSAARSEEVRVYAFTTEGRHWVYALERARIRAS